MSNERRFSIVLFESGTLFFIILKGSLNLQFKASAMASALLTWTGSPITACRTVLAEMPALLPSSVIETWCSAITVFSSHLVTALSMSVLALFFWVLHMPSLYSLHD